MTLDIVILGEDGAPSHEVGLGIEEYYQLIGLAGNCPMLSRMADYYGAEAEVEFLPHEVPVLRTECLSLEPGELRRLGIEGTVQRLIEIADVAIATGRALSVLPD